MACTALAPELESHGLTPCWYVALYCREHSELPSKRSPPGAIPVRLCAALCDCTLLGGGGTNKPLPFHDVVNPPLRTSSGVALMSPPEEPYYQRCTPLASLREYSVLCI